jgi:hypothetical protein
MWLNRAGNAIFAAHAYVTMLSSAGARLLLRPTSFHFWSQDHDRDGTLHQRRTIKQTDPHHDARQRVADQPAQARCRTAGLIA